MINISENLIQENYQRELRNLNLMFKTLTSYQQKKMKLCDTTYGIESLINSLQICTENYKDQLRSYWATLEVEYSFQVVHQKASLSKEEQTDVDNAIDRLIVLTLEKITELKKWFLMNVKKEFGVGLKKHVLNKKDPEKTGAWVCIFLANHSDVIDSDFENALLTLSTMEDGKQFYYTEEELLEIAENFINGKEVKL
jgi:hypothetical protein